MVNRFLGTKTVWTPGNASLFFFPVYRTKPRVDFSGASPGIGAQQIHLVVRGIVGLLVSIVVSLFDVVLALAGDFFHHPIVTTADKYLRAT